MVKGTTKYNSSEWIGKKYGRLTIKESVYMEHERKGKMMWMFRCECDCGNEMFVQPSVLVYGRTLSCGCINKEKNIARLKARAHRYNTTEHKRLWWKFCAIKARCYNKNHVAYDKYGGRGIKVCDEWINDFDAFCDWAYANGYEDNLTIERIDVNGDYSPENCKFITLSEQTLNKRNTIWVDYYGEHIQLIEICRRKNVSYHMAKHRIKHLGWTAERAIDEPSMYDCEAFYNKCNERGLNPRVVQERIKKLGWSEEDAFNTASIGKANKGILNPKKERAICQYCGKEFEKQYQNQRYCCKACQKTKRNIRAREYRAKQSATHAARQIQTTTI